MDPEYLTGFERKAALKPLDGITPKLWKSVVSGHNSSPWSVHHREVNIGQPHSQQTSYQKRFAWDYELKDCRWNVHYKLEAEAKQRGMVGSEKIALLRASQAVSCHFTRGVQGS